MFGGPSAFNRTVGCSGSAAPSVPTPRPFLRAVARADGKPCAHDELATNRGTDDRPTSPSPSTA